MIAATPFSDAALIAAHAAIRSLSMPTASCVVCASKTTLVLV